MTGQTFLFASFLAPAAFKTYQYIVEYIERHTAVPSILLQGEMLDDFKHQYADAGIISPLAYLELLTQQQCPVELVAAPMMRESGSQEFTFFDVVVARKSCRQSIADLHGCIWAYATRAHTAEDRLLYEETALQFRQVVETPSQMQALRMVMNGEADATAVDTSSLALVLRNSPRMAAQLRILSTYSNNSGPLVVVASHVRPQQRRKIQEALVTMHLDPFYAERLQEDGLEQFVAASNEHYQQVGQRNELLKERLPALQFGDQKVLMSAVANTRTAHSL